MKLKLSWTTIAIVALLILVVALPALAQERQAQVEVAAVGTAFYLALINKTLIDYLADPIKKKYPNTDMWWIMYIALVTGAGLAWVSGINIFEPTVIPNVLMARILTSILVGGGAKILHDVTARLYQVRSRQGGLASRIS